MNIYFVIAQDGYRFSFEVQPKQNDRGDTVYYSQGEWLEATNKSQFAFFAEQTVPAGKKGYIRTAMGDIIEASNGGLQKLQTPGKCEILAVSSGGSLLACFHNLGVYELTGDWKLLLKTPYPATEDDHWVHLAEDGGQIALSVTPIPHLAGDKTVYNSSAALWVFDGKRVEKIAFPK